MAETQTYKPGSADNYVNPKTGKRAFDISKVPFGNTKPESKTKPKQKSEMSDEEIIEEMSRKFTL